MNDEELKTVKSPDHYTFGWIEAKDALASMMAGSDVSSIVAYWWGCAFKYLWRWPHKNWTEDLLKCKQCIDYLIDELPKRG